MRDADRVAVSLGRLLEKHGLQPIALHHARHVALLGARRPRRLEACLAEGGRAGARVHGEAQSPVDARRERIHPLHAAKLAQCLLATPIEAELIAPLTRSPGGVGRSGGRRQRVVQIHAPPTLGEHDRGQGSGGASAHHSRRPRCCLAGIRCCG